MRRWPSSWTAIAGAFLLTSGLVAPVRAQDPEDLRRGVARISLINGEVNVRRGDAGEWVAAVINAPLMSEDRIATGPNSRAEVQFDSANVLRIGGNAELRLAQLDYNRYQMELARGTVTYRIIRASSINVELDTPNISIRPAKQGAYRITVSAVGDTEVTARLGDVEIFTPRGSQWLSAGQTMMARGSAADPEFQVVSAIPSDDWDRWCDSRDRFVERSPSYQYVPPGVYGVEDLDAYGSWTNVPSYGYCWRPTVGAGWAPYGSGRWVWEDWYGWTWVSYDPWGWAPYHYGRWFWQAPFGWLWYPGVIGVRHYWSPALVGFFGFGVGGGFGFGFGNIGWVPLAPFEVFHPWWGRGFYGGYFNRTNINITNVNITNIYRNARVGNGVSGMRTADFQAGRFSNMQRVAADQFRTAGLVRGQMPIAPTNAHLQFANRPVANIPRSSENTRFFAHQQPAPAARVPFAQQQRAMEQGTRAVEVPNRGFGAGGGAQNASRQGAFQVPAQSGQVPRGGAANTGGDWRRFGDPGASNARAATAVPRNENRGEFNNAWRGSQSPALQNTRPQAPAAPVDRGGGWQRFGSPGNAPRQDYMPRSEPRGNPGNGGFGMPQRYNAPVENRGEFNNAWRGAQTPSLQNTRPQAPAAPVDRGGGWQRFGSPGNAPRQDYTPRSEPRGNPGNGGFGMPQRYNAPVVRERPNAPSYSAPRSYGAPSYSAPRSYGGGGGGHPSGGGGGHSGGGGGGGNRGRR